MIDAFRSRAALLVCCAAIGVGLALAGSAVGATGSIASSGSSPSFVVAEDTVTYQDGGERTTVVANVTEADRIEFEEVDDGQFRVTTEQSHPLSADERDAAIEIAQSNASFQRALGKVDDPELAVEPIRKLQVNDAINMTTSTAAASAITENATAETFTIESEGDDGTVTVDREPEYVENEADVRIQDDSGNTEFSVVVDLQNETVVDGIDWDDG
ncbi:hypothetical protein [Salinarchaeum laminariae]|uniref:hypothetical protein n=1 Tax=Salinarchaeum laminariae TaxID=869888 RepID=UPI0020BFDE51|nr:hypothetical protein [Salinarchaeum laminariae]